MVKLGSNIFKLFFLQAIIILLTISCYQYKFAYRLIEKERIKPDLSGIPQDGIELIKYFPEKYYLVLGIVKYDESLLLFNKRKPVLLKKDGRVYATNLDGDQVSLSINEIKYYYVKRVMPATEKEQSDP
jgi:hypothetical protein